MLKKSTDSHLESLELLLKGARQAQGIAPGGAVGSTLQSLSFLLGPDVFVKTRASRC